MPNVNLLDLGAVFIGTVCAALGQLFLKLGADGRTTLAGFLNAQVFGGLFLYGVGTLFWVFALSRLPLTVVYSFTALTFVLVYGLSVAFLGEALRPSAAAGMGLVLLGLYLIVNR